MSNFLEPFGEKVDVCVVGNEGSSKDTAAERKTGEGDTSNAATAIVSC